MKTHCKYGHEFTVENTRYTKNGWKVCLTCKKNADKKFWDKPKNKAKRKAYLKAWRKKNTKLSRLLALKHYDKIRDYIEKCKNNPCQDCGQSFPAYVMDFHHRNPDEKITVVGRTRSIKAAKNEIEKCDLLCANCHRTRTWKDKGRPKREAPHR